MNSGEYEKLAIDSWVRAFDAVSPFAHHYLKFIRERIGEFAGKTPADKAMELLLNAIEIPSSDDEQWETAFQRSWTLDPHADLPLMALLIDCFSFAHDGLLLRRSDHNEIPAEEAVSLLIKRSNDWWANNRGIEQCSWASDFTWAIKLANARWNLDHGRPIEPEALAQFGDVTESRIRNLMADKSFSTQKKDGKTLIEASSALRWLENRKKWNPSLWRNPHASPGSMPLELLTGDESFAFVPIAVDGSIFCPKLSRDGVFSIGCELDYSEQTLSTYPEALEALQKMPRPKWLRPTKASEAWTLVSADRWVRMKTSELEKSDIHPI